MLGIQAQRASINKSYLYSICYSETSPNTQLVQKAGNPALPILNRVIIFHVLFAGIADRAVDYPRMSINRCLYFFLPLTGAIGTVSNEGCYMNLLVDTYWQPVLTSSWGYSFREL